ncbi:MAG: DNA repair protein RadA [Synergistota bacterium]|nr:DNA repair protein RadA [Synergistota bacterium]
MAKREAARYFCSVCGASSASWAGRCPSCGEWGTLEKGVAEASDGSRAAGSVVARRIRATDAVPRSRVSSGFDDLDRVLGGGFVPGGVYLLGGQPGIGKSTLLLQTCGKMTERGAPALYISGEESEAQIAMRAKRLEVLSDDLILVCTGGIAGALEALPGMSFMVVDSVQAMSVEGESGWPGSPAQVRAVAQMCISAAKDLGIPAVLVGHITKEGRIAGPMLLEHMVDAVLSFSGEDYSPYRMLRAVKNRYGSTEELGVFEMSESGLAPVQDVSGLYWNRSSETVPGVAMTVAVEGSLPLIAEIQSLAVATAFPYPKRTGRGVDVNKMQLFSAVLEKRCGVGCSLFDIYVNIAGGLQLREPAADLAICAALASSVRDEPLPADCVFLGEVGLAGEVRPVVRLGRRLQEAARLGFKKAVISSRERESGRKPPLETIRASTLKEALKAVIG